MWAKINVGGKAINTFREMVEDKFGVYLTDFRFHGHLTVYQGIEASEEAKERFRASLAGTTLAPINLVVVTLRERKIPGQELKAPLMQVPLGTNLKEFGGKENKGGVMKA